MPRPRFLEVRSADRSTGTAAIFRVMLPHPIQHVAALELKTAEIPTIAALPPAVLIRLDNVDMGTHLVSTTRGVHAHAKVPMTGGTATTFHAANNTFIELKALSTGQTITYLDVQMTNQDGSAIAGPPEWSMTLGIYYANENVREMPQLSFVS